MEPKKPLPQSKKPAVSQKKKSFRFVWGLIILVVLGAALGYLGYERLLVPRLIKYYVNSTVTDYNQLQDDFDTAGESFKNLDVLESKKIASFTSDIDKAIKTVEDNQTAEEKRYVPGQCKELHEKIFAYYRDSKEALNETKEVVSYFEDLGDIVADLEKATIDSNSQNLDTVLKDFKSSQKTLNQVVSQMNKVTAPADLKKLHRDFTKLIKILRDFTTNTVKALEDEDYDEVKTLTNKMETDQKSYSDKINQDFNQFKTTGEIGNWSVKLQKQGEEINRLVSDLKTRYHF